MCTHTHVQVSKRLMHLGFVLFIVSSQPVSPHKQVESPVNWSVDQVQQLQYAHLIHKVTEQQQEWTRLYDKFVQEGVVGKGGTAAPSKQVGGGGLRVCACASCVLAHHSHTGKVLVSSYTCARERCVRQMCAVSGLSVLLQTSTSGPSTTSAAVRACRSLLCPLLSLVCKYKTCISWVSAWAPCHSAGVFQGAVPRAQPHLLRALRCQHALRQAAAVRARGCAGAAQHSSRRRLEQRPGRCCGRVRVQHHL